MENKDLDTKIYFKEGDIVQLRQDIPNKPTMYVTSIEKGSYRSASNVAENSFVGIGSLTKGSLKGIRCRWFADNQTLQEAIFNTKDLIKL